MLRAIMGAGLVAFTSCAALAQTAENSPAFEVASVKPAAPITGNTIRVMMRGGPGSSDPGQITYTNVSLKSVLMNAYGVKDFQISGPGWLDSERYDIVAKVPRGATKEQSKVMMQNLLAERFKLTLHREKKDLPMYALVVGKNGPKLKESVEDPLAAAAMRQPTMGKDGFPVLPAGLADLSATAMMATMQGYVGARMTASGTMAGLAEMLSSRLDLPVVDMTGLTGKYDYTLSFSLEGLGGMKLPFGIAMPPLPPPSGAPPPGEGGTGMPAASAPDSPDLFSALQEQLGLKLEQRKGPVEVLVIARVEKIPTQN